MMLFFSESNVLPQHGALRRGWLKLRLYLRRLAAIGAGAVELRGFFGAWTRFLGRLTRFFSWLALPGGECPAGALFRLAPPARCAPLAAL